MKKLLIICTVIGMLFAATVEVHADVYGVTYRADLAGDDYVDWGQLGTPYGWGKWAGPTVMIPVSVNSSNGIGLDVSNPPYNGLTIYMTVRQQSMSWGGTFAPYDILIGNMWDQSLPEGQGPGPMTINFDEPVYGVGAQINPFNYGVFNAAIEAFDSSWNSLGQVVFNNLQFPGYTSDDTAPFIGILSDIGNISHVVIASGRGAFVINQIDLVTVEPTIPDTATLSIPGSSGLMLLQCEKLREDEIAKNSLVTSVQTDGFSGTIYTTNGTYSYGGNLPMIVQIDGVSANLTDLEGVDVKKIKVLQDSCVGFDPQSNQYIPGLQLTFLATPSNNGGGGNGGGGNGGNGGQQTVKLKEFEGFIETIGASDIVIDKEGTLLFLTISNQTQITLNGQSATLYDLLPGDKAKTKYDLSNNEASTLKVER